MSAVDRLVSITSVQASAIQSYPRNLNMSSLSKVMVKNAKKRPTRGSKLPFHDQKRPTSQAIFSMKKKDFHPIFFQCVVLRDALSDYLIVFQTSQLFFQKNKHQICRSDVDLAIYIYQNATQSMTGPCSRPNRIALVAPGKYATQSMTGPCSRPNRIALVAPGQIHYPVDDRPLLQT